MALNPTPDYPASSNSFVKTITVWMTGSALVGIQLTLFNNVEVKHGSTSPCTLQPGQRFWGGGYQSGTEADRLAPFPATVRSVVECQARCAADPACATFVYNIASGSCYRLKTRFAGSTADAVADGQNITWASGSCPGPVAGCAVCNANTTSGDSYTFQRGETIQALSLWDDSVAAAAATASTRHCGGLTFTTSSGRAFSARAPGLTAPREAVQPVGSGIVAGIYGRFGNAVDALGFIFVPALAEAPFISGVRLVPRAGTEGVVEAQLAAPAYAVSQLCVAPATGSSAGGLACQSTGGQTWRSQQSLMVTQSIGLQQSVNVKGNVSSAAFKSGSVVSAAVGNATFVSNTVTAIATSTVGLTGLVSIKPGQTLVVSSTVQLVRLRAVYWTGRITFRTTAGTVLYVAVDGTYDLTLVTKTCSEAVTRGSTPSKCKCGVSCAQQVLNVFPPTPPNSLAFAPGTLPPYLLTLPISQTDQTALKPFPLAAAKVLGSPAPAPKSSAGSSGYQEARRIWTPITTASAAPTFVKELTVPADSAGFLYIDFEGMVEIFVNGELAGAVSGSWISQVYDQIFFRQPSRVQLRRGVNTLALRCTPSAAGTGSGSGFPAGLSVSIVDNGSNSGKGKQLGVTDASWKVYTAASPPYVFGVTVLGAAGSNPWGSDNIGPDAFPDSDAKWIWTGPATAATSLTAAQPVFFKTYVSSSNYGSTAQLHIMVADEADVYLNEAYVATVTGGFRPGEYLSSPLTLNLARGANLLAIRCRSYGGSAAITAGLLASMTVYEDYGSSTVVVRTDETWSVLMEALPAAAVLGPSQMDPWHLSSGGPAFPDAQAAWIWSQPWADLGASTDLVPTFWKTVTVPAPTQAQLYVVADDSADISLNGAYLTSVRGASPAPIQVSLQAGDNLLALRASNADGGAAGVLASLVLANDGVLVLARTDGSWTYTVEGPAPADCPYPYDWCNGAGESMKYGVDCDGDGLNDWVCARADGAIRGAIISSVGCVSGSWPYLPVTSCPAAFK